MKNWLKKFIVCGVLSAAAIASSTSANAVMLSRTNHVLIGGSYIEGSRGCTLGVVLKKDGWWRHLLRYQLTTRYGITAGSCTQTGQVIKGENHLPIGRTIAVDRDHDTALIEIYPLSSPDCRWVYHHGSGAGRHCVPTSTWRPRALGRVFMMRSGTEAQIPVSGSGSPADGAEICTSGMGTGVNCYFSSMPASNVWPLGPGRRLARTNGSYSVHLDPGDLGGPITNSEGTFFGIHNTIRGRGTATTLIGWIPAHTLFERYHGYSLAPS